MQTGTKISAAGHAVLIGWALVGGLFRSESEPVETREVSIISSSEFAALIAAQQSPDAAAELAALSQPSQSNEPPTRPTSEQPIDTSAPDAAAVPDPQTDTAPAELPEPLPPETEVSESTPTPQAPAESVAVLTPLPDTRPDTRPAERIAPQAVAPPSPEAAPDEIEQPEVTPDAGADTPQPVQEATAPEEAAERIVPEADSKPELAPARSIRPAARPARRPESAEPTETAANPGPEPDNSATETAVEAALAEVLGRAPEAPAGPTGPPMTSGEKDALRISVSRCWNVGSLSSAALETTVVVAVSMSEDAKPVASTIRMLSSSGGSAESAKQAFETARRAIIRCGASGFDLPAEKYSHWRDIEMTFNPERMRIR